MSYNELYDDEEELLQEPPVALPNIPVPVDDGASLTPDAILRRRFGGGVVSPESMRRMSESEGAADENRLYARLAGAGAQIGSSIAGANNFNSKPFDDLAATADLPVKAVDKRIALKQGQDKVLREHLLKREKLKAQGKATAETARFRQEKLDEDRRHNRAVENNATKAADYKIPPEERPVIEKLAGDRGNKIAIATLIDENLRDWDTLSEDQQLSRGRSMIKAMNSALGNDAVGAEESRRLGEKLEYAMGNFTNDNPFRLGRDLKGFKEQAQGSIKVLRRSADENAKQVEAATGRKSKIPLSAEGAGYSQDVLDYAKKYSITPAKAQEQKLKRTSGGR